MILFAAYYKSHVSLIGSKFTPNNGIYSYRNIVTKVVSNFMNFCDKLFSRNAMQGMKSELKSFPFFFNVRLLVSLFSCASSLASN